MNAGGVDHREFKIAIERSLFDGLPAHGISSPKSISLSFRKCANWDSTRIEQHQLQQKAPVVEAGIQSALPASLTTAFLPSQAGFFNHVSIFSIEVDLSIEGGCSLAALRRRLAGDARAALEVRASITMLAATSDDDVFEITVGDELNVRILALGRG